MTEATFSGQVALVTGASRGIGRAIAAELVGRGLTVVGTATGEAGLAAIAAIGASGAVLNVNDGASVEAGLRAIDAPLLLVASADDLVFPPRRHLHALRGQLAVDADENVGGLEHRRSLKRWERC